MLFLTLFLLYFISLLCGFLIGYAAWRLFVRGDV